MPWPAISLAIHAGSRCCSRPRFGSASPISAMPRWSSLHGEVPASSRPDRAVLGLAAVEAALEFVFGRLDPQPLASQLFGFYRARVFHPDPGGLIPPPPWSTPYVIIGGVLMAIGHFLMAFEALFLLALLAADPRHRRVQAQHLGPGRRPLSAGGSPARPRLLDLLRRHQYRGIRGPARLRHAGGPIRLALWLRRRRSGHAGEPRHLSLWPARPCRPTNCRQGPANGRRGEDAARPATAVVAVRALIEICALVIFFFLGRPPDDQQGIHHRALGRGFHRPVDRPQVLAGRDSLAPGSWPSIRS